MLLALVIATGTGSNTSAPQTGADHLARAAGAAPRTRSCRALRRSLRYYVAAANGWRAKTGARVRGRAQTSSCPRYLASLWRSKARAARVEYRRWVVYHYHWWKWLPSKWQRIGACETGYGKRPGDFHWNSGAYQGFAGFAVSSWDSFRLPGYPSEAYLATPREQFNVALAIYRRYGFSGWGCRGA